MKKIFLLFSLLICILTSQAQKVELLKLDELYQRIDQGKDTTYVVNFWATWCAPCVKEIPYFDQLQSDFKQDKLKVLLVSVDFKSKLNSTVIPFVAKEKIKSQVYILNEKNQQDYIERVDPKWTGSIPATLFINKSKNIRSFFEKEFSYTELLKQYEISK